MQLLKKQNNRLHLGCGKDIIKGMINCDIQSLWGVDYVMDCSNLTQIKDKSVSLIFAHSFFEHLYLYQQDPFLQQCRRVLNDNGVMVLLGIPDFEKVAELYVKKADAVKPFEGEFSLYQVYRLTHGDYEEEKKASIPQLHKTLFDKVLISELLEMSGFADYSIFNYKPPNEQYKLAIGVVVRKKRSIRPKAVKEVLSEFKKYINDFEKDIE